MPRPPKHHEISKLLKQRIASGMYLDQQIPGERALAAETGVSYMTARKAVQQLVEEKILDREKNGRLTTHAKQPISKAKRAYAFVTPAFDSFSYTNARMAIERVMSKYNGVLKHVSYRHWHDTSLMTIFDGDWNGIFICPPVGPIPKLLMDRMLAARDRLVVLYQDYTEHGIVSVDNSLESWSNVLVDHMVSLGHDRVDCINTQPGTEVKGRINGWQNGVTQNGITGQLYDQPVENFDFPWVGAYELTRQKLQTGELARAIFCTNLAIAKGVGRAAHELGLTIGKDIVYCTMDTPYEAVYEIPSVTTLNLHALHHYIQKAFEWLEFGDAVLQNDNRLLVPMQPPDLLLGESTGFKSKVCDIKLNETYKDS
jgi:DNA-binding LacI/PurR family transcriptional regulator